MGRTNSFVFIISLSLLANGTNVAAAQQTGFVFPGVPFFGGGIIENCVTLTTNSGVQESRFAAQEALQANVRVSVDNGKSELSQRIPGIRRMRYRSGGPYCGFGPGGHTCYEVGSVCGVQPGRGSVGLCPPGQIPDRESGICQTFMRDTQPGALAPRPFTQ